jgi:hypothetical protein
MKKEMHLSHHCIVIPKPAAAISALETLTLMQELTDALREREAAVWHQCCIDIHN